METTFKFNRKDKYHPDNKTQHKIQTQTQNRIQNKIQFRMLIRK